MSENPNREKLRGQVQSIAPAELLPHQRRDALILVSPEIDFIEAALAIANDDASQVENWLADGSFSKPSLAEMADFCVQPELRFQFIILQPFVLAQAMLNTLVTATEKDSKLS